MTERIIYIFEIIDICNKIPARAAQLFLCNILKRVAILHKHSSAHDVRKIVHFTEVLAVSHIFINRSKQYYGYKIECKHGEEKLKMKCSRSEFTAEETFMPCFVSIYEARCEKYSAASAVIASIKAPKAAIT